MNLLERINYNLWGGGEHHENPRDSAKAEVDAAFDALTAQVALFKQVVDRVVRERVRDDDAKSRLVSG